MEANKLDCIHYKLLTLSWMDPEIQISSHRLALILECESLLFTSGGKVRCYDVIYDVTAELGCFATVYNTEGSCKLLKNIFIVL